MAKEGLGGTTVFVNKQGKFIGKTMPNSKRNIIRDAKGHAVGKSFGCFGASFSPDEN